MAGVQGWHYVRWNYQQVDEADGGGEDQREGHGTREVIVKDLVILRREREAQLGRG